MIKKVLLIFVLLCLFMTVFAGVDMSGENPIAMGAESQGDSCLVSDFFWGDEDGRRVNEILPSDEVYLLVEGSSCQNVEFNLIIYNSDDVEIYLSSSLTFNDESIGGESYSELTDAGDYYFKVFVGNEIYTSGELTVIDTSIECEIVSGHWEDLNGNVLDGEYFDSESQLKIHLEASNCVGSSLNIAIYEEDFLVNTDVDELVVTSVSSDDVIIDWITPEYEAEGLIAGNPEYIFEVSNNEGDILFESAQLILVDNDNPCATYSTADSCNEQSGCEPTYYLWIALGGLFKECVEEVNENCILDRINIDDGESSTFYQNEIDDECVGIDRVCNDGVLEGDDDYIYSSCAVNNTGNPYVLNEWWDCINLNNDQYLRFMEDYIGFTDSYSEEEWVLFSISSDVDIRLMYKKINRGLATNPIPTAIFYYNRTDENEVKFLFTISISDRMKDSDHMKTITGKNIFEDGAPIVGDYWYNYYGWTFDRSTVCGGTGSGNTGGGSTSGGSTSGHCSGGCGGSTSGNSIQGSEIIYAITSADSRRTGDNDEVEFCYLDNDVVHHGKASCEGDWWITPCSGVGENTADSYCSSGWDYEQNDYYVASSGTYSGDISCSDNVCGWSSNPVGLTQGFEIIYAVGDISSAEYRGDNDEVEFCYLDNGEVWHGKASCEGDWWITPCSGGGVNTADSYCDTTWEYDSNDYYIASSGTHSGDISCGSNVCSGSSNHNNVETVIECYGIKDKYIYEFEIINGVKENFGEEIENCNMVINNGVPQRCHTVNGEPECQDYIERFEQKCVDNEVVWFDSTGKKGSFCGVTISQCSASETCVENNDGTAECR